MAVDGQPVSPAAVPEQMVLAPAQRLDLIVDVTAAEGEEAAIVVIDRDGAYAAVELPISGTAREARLGPPVELTPNPVPRPTDLAGAARARLVMEGGAMGGMASARLGAETLDIRTLVGRGKAWAFNGHAGMDMAAPLFEVPRGQVVRIEMVNDTRWPHAMHVHGHHFQKVEADMAGGPLWDTYLMDPQQTVEIAFVADNPGDWMFHCHMAEHMEAGMMTWFRVT
jgi:FtsP/CotA-like multicopper oxidase with cupredoxin domain